MNRPLDVKAIPAGTKLLTDADLDAYLELAAHRKSESCNAYLTYDIGDGGPRSDCRHNDGAFYCLNARDHAEKHRTEVTFSASSDKEPFLYEHTVSIEWD